MAKPLVSLIIPTYNADKYLVWTLESVLAQSLKEFECILVNDCSPDGSKQIIDNYIRKDKRFKAITHRANGGLSAARNSGLRFAKGKYIAFLDADDLIMPDSLLKRAKTLENSCDDKVIGTYAGSVSIPNECQAPPVGKEVKLKVIDFITAGGNCPFNANQPMFKTEIFRKIGGFDESLKQAEDYDMWIRVLRRGFCIVPTNEQLVTYRQTPGSMIKNNPLLHLDTSFMRYSKCFATLPDSQLDDRFKINLSKGLSEYLQEMNIANRVLEFSGIALSKGDDLDSILDRLLKYLPNYFQIIENHRDFRKEVQKGINRYFGRNIDLNLAENKKVKERLEELYVAFKIKSSQMHSLQYQMISQNSFDITSEAIARSGIVLNSAVQAKIDVLFFPHKDYHVYTIWLLNPYLKNLGVNFHIVDFSCHYRDEGVKLACEKYDLPFIGYSNFLLGNFYPEAIVVFNDWDPISRSILYAARHAGIKTIGIVEGIQDYLDADTKQDRKAYQSVEYLFLPGEHDKKYFSTSPQTLFVGGIPRIYDLYHKHFLDGKKNSKKKGKVALINSNFSYGVLEECRDSWLSEAVDACKSQGFKVVVSRHPADKGELFKDLVTDKGFYEALEESDVCISRFASGILESLAMGVMPVYFNPHNEKVDKFKIPEGAYPIANSTEELCGILDQLDENYKSCHQYFERFLTWHCGSLSVDPAQTLSEQLASLVSLGGKKVDMTIFAQKMHEIDMISGSFNNVQALRKYLNENASTFNLSVKATKTDIADYVELVQQGRYKEALKFLNKTDNLDENSDAIQIIKKSIEFLAKR